MFILMFAQNNYAYMFQLDVVAFANLAQIYYVDKEVQFTLRDYMQESCANLVGHVNRMKERYEFLHILCQIKLIVNLKKN